MNVLAGNETTIGLALVVGAVVIQLAIAWPLHLRRSDGEEAPDWLIVLLGFAMVLNLVGLWFLIEGSDNAFMRFVMYVVAIAATALSWSSAWKLYVSSRVRAFLDSSDEIL